MQLKLHVVALFINNDNHNSFYGAVLTKDVTTEVVVEWLTLLLRIREVPASNLDLETGYSECFVVFLSPFRRISG
jgi:hypothetical protein